MGASFASRALVLVVFATCCFVGRPEASSVTGVVVGADYRSWKEKAGGAGDVSISQGRGLLTVDLQLAPTADLIFSNSGASSKLGTGGSDLSLDGLGSLSSALQVRLADDRLLLKLTATAPSGKRELDAKELQVVEAIGHPLLGFGLRHYGTGFEGGGSATWGPIEAPGSRVTVGVGGLVRGAYRLFQGASDFHPASEWAATTGLDLGTSSRPTGVPVRLDLTYRGFGTDRLGDVDVFKEGAQFEIQAQGLADRVPFHWSGVLRSVLKSDNTTLGPAGSAVADFKANSGSAAVVLLGVDHDAGSKGRLGLVAEHDLVTGSDASGRDGSVTGVGPHGQLSLEGGTSLDLTTRYWWGRVDAASGGGRHDIHGVSAELELRWSGSP
jgi:hypothetical protein